MSNFTGFAVAAAVIGLGAVMIKPKRGFFPFDKEGQPLDPIKPQVTIEEIGQDELQITEHPIERGSVISDHAFKRPAEVIIRASWSNGIDASVRGVIDLVSGSSQAGGGLKEPKAVYAALLALQVSGVPFDVWTGKREYKDMLFRSLTCTTDRIFENTLLITATCRQVMIVNTVAVTVPINPNAQKFPKATTATQNNGQQQLQSYPGYVAP